MRTLRTISFTAALLALPLAFAFAGGAGGIMWGDERPLSGFSSTSAGLSSVGGFGYGVSAGGQRTGGFGFALYSGHRGESLTGGVGGIIIGQQTMGGPFMAAINLWTGLGGVSASPSGSTSGYCVLFGEANVEVGAAVTPWMQLVLYGGLQGFADVSWDTGIGGQVLRYAPVIGMRLSWGSFGSH